VRSPHPTTHALLPAFCEATRRPRGTILGMTTPNARRRPTGAKLQGFPCTKPIKTLAADQLSARCRLVAVLLFTTAVVAGQDHAPTVAQCQADQKLWWQQLNSEPGEISRLTVIKLNERGLEMGNCGAVDEDRVADYDRVMALLTLEREKRIGHFLDRHHLTAQFLSEDAAGKR
jgi:hypothetical protein